MKVEFFGKLEDLKNKRFFRYPDISKMRNFFCKENSFFVRRTKMNFHQRNCYKYLTKTLSIRKYCQNIVKFFLSYFFFLPFFLVNFRLKQKIIAGKVLKNRTYWVSMKDKLVDVTSGLCQKVIHLRVQIRNRIRFNALIRIANG
jgi:riboflavin transporter FmnP